MIANDEVGVCTFKMGCSEDILKSGLRRKPELLADYSRYLTTQV